MLAMAPGRYHPQSSTPRLKIFNPTFLGLEKISIIHAILEKRISQSRIA
jgi:hypothetical protein